MVGATRLTVMAAAAAAAVAVAARGAWRAARELAMGAAAGCREVGEIAGGGARYREIQIQLSMHSWPRRSRCLARTAPPAARTRRIQLTSSRALTSPVAEAPHLG